MDFNNNSKDVTSRYNEASLQIMRLHNLWSKNHQFYFEGDWAGQKGVLNRIWIELSADAIKKNKNYVTENIQHDKNIYEAEQRLNIAIYRLNNKGFGDDDITLKKRIQDAKGLLYNQIQKKEVWLKVLQNAVGKGSSYKDLREDSII